MVWHNETPITSLLMVRNINRARAYPEGVDRGSGTPPPLKNHQNIGFLSNTGLDPLKIKKLPSQHSMLSHHRHASETPFAGGPMVSRL